MVDQNTILWFLGLKYWNGIVLVYIHKICKSSHCRRNTRSQMTLGIPLQKANTEKRNFNSISPSFVCLYLQGDPFGIKNLSELFRISLPPKVQHNSSLVQYLAVQFGLVSNGIVVRSIVQYSISWYSLGPSGIIVVIAV